MWYKQSNNRNGKNKIKKKQKTPNIALSKQQLSFSTYHTLHISVYITEI